MNLTFYRVDDENIAVPKVKNLMIQSTGTLKDPSTIEDPVIKIARNDYLLNSNYFHIQEFGRYYFRKSLTIEGQFFIITGHVDVLDSFWDDTSVDNKKFKDVVQVIDRQEYAFNLNLRDAELPITEEKTFQMVRVGTSPFNVSQNSVNNNAFFPFVLNVCNAGTQGGS